MKLKDCIKGEYYVYKLKTDINEYIGISEGGDKCKIYAGAGHFWRNGDHWNNSSVRSASPREIKWLNACITAKKYVEPFKKTFIQYLLNKHFKNGAKRS